jgi:hypothetical protein
VAWRNNFSGTWRLLPWLCDLPDEAANFVPPTLNDPSGEINMKSLNSEITAIHPQSSISLVRNESIEIADAIGCRISCLSGSVWLSCTEKKGMMAIEEGESFVIQCRGNAIVQARNESVVALTDNPSVRLGLGRLPSDGLHIVRIGAQKDHALPMR